MDARIIRGAAICALVVPLVVITQSPAGAGTADNESPTYREYSVPSSVYSGEADDSEVGAPAQFNRALCEGDPDSRDTAVAVGQSDLPLPASEGLAIYENGRAVGFSTNNNENFVLVCRDDHSSGHGFNL